MEVQRLAGELGGDMELEMCIRDSADIAGNPARERRVEAVVNGEGERQGPQNRQHD